MHGLVLLDEADRVLRPAILWNDQRTAAECDAIRAALGPERLVAITGNDALTGFTAPKLVWVRDHEPEVWRRAAHVLLPKDYLRLRLTGEHAMDKADGSGTLLFDLAARDWSDEVLSALAIPRDWLPPTFEGPQVTGAVTDRAAAATGLRAGTPVVAGGGDQAANAVGVGVVSPGHDGAVARDVGRRLRRDRPAVVRAARTRPRVLPRGPGSLAPHVGDAVRGRQPALVPRHPRARGVVRGPRGLGQRTCPPGPTACSSCPTCPASGARIRIRWRRGAFVGLTLGHDRRHMTRAVLEGVAFGLRDGLDLMTEAGMPAPAQIRASGGGLASPALASDPGRRPRRGHRDRRDDRGRGVRRRLSWRQWPPAGTRPSRRPWMRVVRVTPVAEPGPDASAYAERHAVYRDLYPALAPTFRRL